MRRWIVGSSLQYRPLVIAFALALMFSGGAQLSKMPVAAGEELPGLVVRHADTLIVNGKVATVDPAFQFAEALAIRDGRVLAVGSRADVERLAGPRTRRIDVGGRTVVPGLIDTHEHLHEYALDHWEADIAAAEPKFREYVNGVAVDGTSVEEVLRAIEGVAASREAGSWINIQLASTAPVDDFWNTIRRQHLDALAPNNPLTVRVVGNNYIANTRVLDEIRAFYGGEPHDFEMDATGALSGRVDVQEIKTIKADLLVERPMASLYNAYKKVLQEWASYGVTTWSSSVEPLTTLPVFREMDRRGEMPIRFAFSHSVGVTDFPYAPQFYARLGDIEGMGTERFWPIGAGVYHVDGNASPSAPWTLCTTLEASPEIKSREMCDLASHHDARRSAIFNAVKYGNRITGTHAAGDAAVDQFMDVLEEASAAAGMTLEDIRARSHVIDHCAFNPRPDQIERARRLNIIWSCGPKYLDGAAQIARDYGETYAHAWVAPIGSILRAGGRVAMEMDTPDVRKQGGVFYYVAKLLTRRDDRGIVWGPQEAIGREDALRMFTIWAAEYVKAENRLGSLEPGKQADLVVLDRDYFSIPVEEFPNIRTLLTLVGGEVVYQHPSLSLQ